MTEILTAEEDSCERCGGEPLYRDHLCESCYNAVHQSDYDDSDEDFPTMGYTVW